jgi:hypothetical protein
MIRGFLFQISAVDPFTFVGGAMFLLIVATIASAIRHSGGASLAHRPGAITATRIV